VTPRGRLFRKYVIVFAGLVSGTLLASGVIEIYFSYQENRAALVALQREKALGVASRIEGFIKEIERQIGWTTQPQLGAPSAAMYQRRVDYLRLLRQVLPITEISYLDADGKEQLRVSRLAMDVAGSEVDFSRDPRFVEAKAGKIYHGPVYFRKESEPYMTIAMAGSGQGAGVTVAEVNLKFIWDVVSQIKIGKAGHAFVLDGQGVLIAHPDISLVLQKTTFAGLDQVKAALAGVPAPGEPQAQVTIARDLKDRRVMTAYATITPLRWSVFVEQPLEEAFEGLYASIQRTIGLLVLGVLLAVAASLLLARRMVTPIQALQAGAARIGAGELDQRIDIRTRDELEALADQFNSMAAQLKESYAGLERKVEARTRELSESLQQQTATAEILRVISSSPTDLGPVMEAVAENAARVCGAADARIYLVEGDEMRRVAEFGALPEHMPERLPLSRVFPGARSVIDRQTVHIEDLQPLLDTEFTGVRERRTAVGGVRTLLATPLMREGVPIGTILIRRTEVQPFTDKQIELLKTFAAQAVIAIENVRLFTELQERNAEVTEALEQQTATAEILRVISSAQMDLTPVFDAILENATQLCDAHLGALGLYTREEGYRHVTERGASAEFRDWLLAGPHHYDETTGVGRMIRDRQAVHIVDVTEEPAYREGNPARLATVKLGGARTFLAVPMLKEGQVVGGLVIYRSEVRPFTQKQVDLVQTFANQAVIAIENVRLFQELQARTRELARSVEELQALGEVGRAVSSTLDVETVLATIVSRANQLAGTDGGAIYEYDEAAEEFHLRATQNLDAALVEILRSTFIRRGEGVMGRLAETREPVQIADILSDPTYQTRLRETVVRTGYRALLAVPLLRENRIMGGLVVNRKTPGQFAPEAIELLRTFAAQSALAIQNARLFQEIEEKSRQLEVANRHKSEFLASMSHELRTPLNAVIGFSEVLLDRMFGEINEKQDEYLQDILSSGRHLLSLINDILDLAKIEAGRMELEVADFHLPQAIDNAITLVRERAARRAIVLEADVDPRLGEIKGDERKVKQVLLNLLSNAIKFTPDGGHIGVHAGLADGFAEISVIDTGVGIAPEDHEAVFEEFRQVGTDYAKKHEGTGLGLTLSRRFVELHGGKIWVKSQLGQGATFTFTLPVTPWQTS
jgi:signal transduction histidine kinase